jgi:hypothetical protein
MVLPQIFDLDNLKNRGIEDNRREIELITQEEEMNNDNHDNEEEIEVRISSWISQSFTRLRDFVTYTVQYLIQKKL